MLEKIIHLVKRAGEIVLSAEDVGAHTHTKTSAADLVTDFDVQVEVFLKRELLTLLPEAVFYGEEEAEREIGRERLNSSHIATSRMPSSA